MKRDAPKVGTADRNRSTHRSARRRRPSRVDPARAIGVVERIDPEIAEWVRGLAEQADPRGSRNQAIRELAELLRENASTTTAKEVERALDRYLSGAWRRGERDLDAPPPGALTLHVALWRAARLTRGEGLTWRTIYDIVEFAQK